MSTDCLLISPHSENDRVGQVWVLLTLRSQVTVVHGGRELGIYVANKSEYSSYANLLSHLWVVVTVSSLFLQTEAMIVSITGLVIKCVQAE